MAQFSDNRRSLLKGGAGLALSSLVSSLQALQARKAIAAGTLAPVVSPFGRIGPVSDQTTGLALLQLPSGFTYKSFAWAGDLMSNGQACPGGHDGMAIVVESGSGGRKDIVLIRNHELGLGSLLEAHARYDTASIASGNLNGAPAGGTTNLLYRNGERVSITPSLGGTLVNCAGGPTPWGSWLTCEETLADLTALGGKKHGYVFEVAAHARYTTGRPIVQMGRFSHEAVAINPKSGYGYLTEDDRNRSALYRYIPHDTSRMLGAVETGGRLQAAKIKGQVNASLLTSMLGDRYELEWVDIAKPDADPGPFNAEGALNSIASGPFLQAWAAGAMRMSRGEGIWYAHKEKKIYIVDTSAGVDANGRIGRGEGAVWELDPKRMTLTAVFMSGSAVAGNNPDNITVSPSGLIVLCEDGGGVADEFGFGDRLIGLNRAGEPFIIAKNNIVLGAAKIAAAGKSVRPDDYRDNEFAGTRFDKRGETLFVNVQAPGMTFAITGPWRDYNK